MYDWKRFWCPRTRMLALADGGYLVDPESDWGRRVNADVAPFEEIASRRCLILLGEPGMGKSSALKAECDATTQAFLAAPDTTYWLDLHEVGSDTQLNRELFDAPEIAAWRAGDYNLHLFLDSFDECRMQIRTLVPRLLRELGRWPVARLYLRVASRTAEWPPSLEDGLRHLWPPDDVEAFELVPLRRRDVQLVARHQGWEPEVFLTEIDRAGVTALAIKPLTLDFLVRTYRLAGTLPSDPLVLYQDGTRLLCEETDRRRELRLVPKLDAQQRKVVAERLAALTVFGNCGAVWTDVDRGDTPEDDLRIGQVANGGDALGDAPFAIDEAAVGEALSTSLFSSRGPRRLGWAHQTYSEFLAASYVARTSLPLPQVRQLLVHPGDDSGKLIPQLRETAAWLAGMREDVFADLIVRDPEVLLRSAASALGGAARASLVDALLSRYNEGSLIDRDWEQRRHYHRLSHPDFARQLHPYIVEKTHDPVARRVAIDIAEACGIRELVDDLVALALASDEEMHARVNAAYAVTRIGSVEERGRLKSLAFVPAEADPNDELKGCGLRAAWPEHLTTDELFALVTPFRGDLAGAYNQFVWSHLVQKLPPNGIPRALRWVRQEIEKEHVPHEYEQLIDDLMRRAWEHLDTPGVLESFVPAALARVRQFDEVFGGRRDRDTLDESADKRRRLLAAVLPMATQEDRRSLVYTSLVRTSDVPWILERLPNLQVNERRFWTALLPLVLDWQDAGKIDAVLDAREADEVVREVLAPFFDAVPLDSPQAQQAREHDARRKRWQARDVERAASAELLQAEVIERIGVYLARFESGELEPWWWLNYELAVDPPHRLLKSEHETDLTSLPGWKLIEAADRSRLIDAAERYVRERAPSGEDWLRTNTIHRPDWAGYRALRLLWQEAPERLTRLPSLVLEAWAAVVVGVHALNSDESAAAQQPLVRLAYQHAPERVISALALLIEREDQTESPDIESILWRVEECWDDRMAQALLHKANNQQLKPRTRGQILQALLTHAAAGARVLAESMLQLPLPTDPAGRELAAQAATALLETADDGGWSAVWPALLADPELGEQVIARLCWNDRWASNTGQRLPVSTVADLYLWLARRYPHEKDVRPTGVHTVGFRERVGDWRDSLLSHLIGRGSRESRDAVQRIAAELPHLEWLKWRVLDAQEATRYRMWTPPSVEDLRALMRSPARRLVQSPEQLLDVVMESLARLEERLQQAEPPAAIDLWNEVRLNVFSPKNENQFSDYVARHLEQDLADRGIVVNREVVVRRGERTDIRISVSRIEGAEETPYPITVVIESKGCWNRDELDTAMEDQLANRYMEEARTQHGVYLVGWFECDLWTHAERRRSDCPTYGIEEARERLDRQAQVLSGGGKHIRAFVMNAGLR